MPGNTPRGIKYPTASDKIKDGSSPSALADDFKALAESADSSTAAAEGAAKAYADSGDTATLNTAKADASAKANKALADAKLDATAKANKAEDNARSYTDLIVKTSHLGVDSDGVPFIQYGSISHRILVDSDGTPYFEAR